MYSKQEIIFLKNIKLIEEATLYNKQIKFNLIILIEVLNLLRFRIYISNKFDDKLMIDLWIYELLNYLKQVIITCVLLYVSVRKLKTVLFLVTNYCEF